MSYAISLSISCICFHANNDTLKGRASAAYERAMAHFNELLDCDWHNLLWDLLIEYVTLLTNPDGTTLSTPSHKKQERLERDIASDWQ